MYLTAHSGANKTCPNSRQFFSHIRNRNVDVIEVDIRKKGDFYYLSHNKNLFPKLFCLPAIEAFRFAAANGFRLNCDVKEEGYIADMVAMAKETGMTERFLITGSAGNHDDVKNLTEGSVYLNGTYLPELLPENVGKIQEILASYATERMVGINIDYRKTSDEFLAACGEAGIHVSLWTINEPTVLLKYAALPYVDNITTKAADDALTALGRKVLK